LKAIALAMGVAVLMVGSLKTLDVNTCVSMLVGGALTDRFTPRKLRINSNLARRALANFQE
jgi:hypothetical protein